MTTVQLDPISDNSVALNIFPLLPTTHYDKVNSNDGDSSYDYPTAPVVMDDVFNFSQLGGTVTINSLTIHTICKHVLVNGPDFASTLYHVIITHSTLYSDAHTITNPNYVDYFDVHATNPFTGTAWTQAEVNAVIAGLGLRYDTFRTRAVYTRCTQVFLIIDFTAVTTRLRRLLVGEGL